MARHAVEEAARQLVHRLEGSVQRALRMADHACLWVGADPASALLATVAQRQSDVPLLLVALADPDEDLRPLRRLASHLALGLVERRVPKAPRGAAADLPRPGTAARGALALVMRTARAFGPRLIVGSGPYDVLAAAAEARDVAPDATWRRTLDEDARAAGVQLRVPWLDAGMLSWARALPGPVRRAAASEAGILAAALQSLGTSWPGPPSRDRVARAQT